MNKSNLIGLGVMAAASVAVVAAADPAYDAIKAKRIQDAAGGVETVTLTGEGEGYGGPVTAEVVVAGEKIVGLTLTGEKETPEIGGAALSTLQESILSAGSLDGVDAVSGATWTSKGAFAAIKSAMGIEKAEAVEQKAEAAAPEAVTAGSLSHGIGFFSNGRLGPGKDDQGVGVYSFNEAVAYVLFDDAGRIVDLEVDQLEVASPNYDGEHMPNFTGFPGQSYNADTDHDEKVDAVLDQTEDTFMADVESWKTKRERGETYKLGSGTWEDEMDLFEEFFKGKTVEEIEQWYAESCSDVNGRPLFGTSENEKDAAKYEAMSEEAKAELDAISGATMSLNDAHGNIIGAIVRAYENREPIAAEKVAKIGLGFTNNGRLGPGKDDQEVGVYSFNTQAAGVCLDEAGKIVALRMDVMEVATPNYDGEHMPHLTGFPGQSYNADTDHDEKVDTVLEQTEETFLAEIESWKTKRERGNTYKLNSGTWEDEMDIFEQKFVGMTADEVAAWYAAYCSDVTGRPLHGTSENEKDIAKYDALSDAEKADLDAISGATMSLNDSHGDLLGAIGKASDNAKDTNVSVASSGGAAAGDLSHGIGFFSNGRLGPGKDDQEVGVYSFNEAVAYVVFDKNDRIVDLEVDQLEVASPNYDGEHMPNLTGFPGQSYNADTDHDEKVDAVLDQTDDTFMAEVETWKTKRERGTTYKLNSGTWEDEMDLFEEFFKGKTVEEIEQWYAESCSDVNGRPLFGTSENEKDIAKYEAMSEEAKADLDAISGATMSLNDAHGNIIGAIVRAYENRQEIGTADVAKIGLGFTNNGRLGPGKDDQEVGVYSFNTQAAGACYDADGRIVALLVDVMEIATPNYDGEHMPHLTGFPGQSYNADADHDEKVDSVLEQTEETFLAEIETWKTKRERGTAYKLNSGTWTDEMDLFQQKFTGMTMDEVTAWYAAYCSDVNGRPLHGTSENEKDIAKYDALSDAEKADLDAISGATMSLNDSHGNLLGAIEKSWTNAKEISAK